MDPETHVRVDFNGTLDLIIIGNRHMVLLHADAVDAAAFILQIPDQGNDTIPFFRDSFTVIVVEQLGVRRRVFSHGAKGRFNKAGTAELKILAVAVDRAFPGVLFRVRHIVPGCFIDYIPGIDIRIEMLTQSFRVGVDAFINQLRRGGTIPVTVHPVGRLVVPDRRVSTDFDTHFTGHGYNGICQIEAEIPFLRFGRFVLHFVFCRQTVKLLQKQVVMLFDLHRGNRCSDFEILFVSLGQRKNFAHPRSPSLYSIMM